jgi:hypothetical protein
VVHNAHEKSAAILFAVALYCANLQQSKHSFVDVASFRAKFFC